jgi:RNA 2',3'-cyclic 3'-phosphodiesterase
MSWNRDQPWRGRRPFVRPADDPPGTSRLFIAVPVADIVRDAVGAIMEKLAGGPVDERRQGQPRWVRVDGLHLTLRFLGATPDDRQADLAAAISTVAADSAPFDVVLAGGGAFPNEYRPRVLWIGIGDGVAELNAVERRLDVELRRLGWPGDDRPFAAHLTLARTDGVPAAEAFAARLIEEARDVRLTWRADRLVLYKSNLGHGPTHYEALATSELLEG